MRSPWLGGWLVTTMRTIPRAPVHRLVRLSGSDLDALACAQREVMVLDLHGQLAFEHEEELPRMHVMMRASRWCRAASVLQ